MLRLPPIKLLQPRTLEEAARAAGGNRVRLVAGGTDLWPNMKRRHQTADTIVSLLHIPDLHGIDDTADELRIGAAVKLSSILDSGSIRERYPAFSRAVASISSPPLRNMATLGGNLCVDTRCNYYNQTEEWRRSIGYCLKEKGDICWVATGSPRCWAHSASDTAPILCALGARVRLVSRDGDRVIPLAEMYRDDGIDYIAKRPDEILAEVLVPAASSAAHCRSSFWKLRRRGSIDFSVMSVAAAVWMDPANVVTAASVYLGAVGSSPMKLSDLTTTLAGKALNADSIEKAAKLAKKISHPLDNTDFTPAWRGKMVHQYTVAALSEIAGLPSGHTQPRHMV